MLAILVIIYFLSTIKNEMLDAIIEDYQLNIGCLLLSNNVGLVSVCHHTIMKCREQTSLD